MTATFRSRLFALVLALALVAVVAACGDDDDDPALGGGADESSSDGSAEDSAEDSGGDIDLDFVADAVDGGEIDMSDYEGQDVVFWFWAPWCTSCNQQAPALAEVIVDRMDVVFVGMTGQADLPEMTDFVDRHDLGGIPHVVDPDGSVWLRFGTITRSAFIFLDDDGTASRTEYGVLSTEEINDRIDELVA